MMHHSDTLLYYKTLDLVFPVSDAEIKKAYIELAKKFHPDRNLDNDTTSKFQSINIAYEVLSDPRSKSIYDYKCLNKTSENESIKKAEAAEKERRKEEEERKKKEEERKKELQKIINRKEKNKKWTIGLILILVALLARIFLT